MAKRGKTVLLAAGIGVAFILFSAFMACLALIATVPYRAPAVVADILRYQLDVYKAMPLFIQHHYYKKWINDPEIPAREVLISTCLLGDQDFVREYAREITPQVEALLHSSATDRMIAVWIYLDTALPPSEEVLNLLEARFFEADAERPIDDFNKIGIILLRNKYQDPAVERIIEHFNRYGEYGAIFTYTDEPNAWGSHLISNGEIYDGI